MEVSFWNFQSFPLLIADHNKPLQFKTAVFLHANICLPRCIMVSHKLHCQLIVSTKPTKILDSLFPQESKTLFDLIPSIPQHPQSCSLCYNPLKTKTRQTIDARIRKSVCREHKMEGITSGVLHLFMRSEWASVPPEGGGEAVASDGSVEQMERMGCNGQMEG